MPCIDTVEDIDKFEIQVRNPEPKPLKNNLISLRVAYRMVLGMMHAWVAHGIPSQSDGTATGLYTHTVPLKPCNELTRKADCPTAVAVLTHQTPKAEAPAPTPRMLCGLTTGRGCQVKYNKENKENETANFFAKKQGQAKVIICLKLTDLYREPSMST